MCCYFFIMNKILFREQVSKNEIEKKELYQKIKQIYLKALKNPMINIDQMWKEYCLFENVKSAEKTLNKFKIF